MILFHISGGQNGIKKKKYNKTTACLAILYMLQNDLGEHTTKYFCSILEIDRFLFYSYIVELNNFFSEFATIYDYPIPWAIEYDRYLKKYVLIQDEDE